MLHRRIAVKLRMSSVTPVARTVTVKLSVPRMERKSVRMKLIISSIILRSRRKHRLKCNILGNGFSKLPCRLLIVRLNNLNFVKTVVNCRKKYNCLRYYYGNQKHDDAKYPYLWFTILATIRFASGCGEQSSLNGF